jgi:hypothetical protein
VFEKDELAGSAPVPIKILLFPAFETPADAPIQMLFDPFPLALAPIEIVFKLLIDPNPARYPRKTPFLTLDVDPPAAGPTNVLLKLLLTVMFECAFPALIPTYTLQEASPTDAAKVETVFAETVSIFTSSSLD